MAKGEIVIIAENCFGCAYCAEFCSQKAIVMSGDKFSSMGFPLPSVVRPDDCNACGNCASMCPHFAIEVYKYVTVAAIARAGACAESAEEGEDHD
jgi:2-oxoglutarate ferredoxin oxidoreductase subunit delta